ncbi:MAG TPA: type II secretion system protein [Burkholderiales bacterium]|nr:type II secretion system protein [Burkholderiales bacterium]
MRARGFSLVELSIVVLVIGIVLTMGIGAWTANLENQAYAATAQRQAAIKEALTGYLRRNNRLPCPDSDFTAPDGIENRATAGDPTTACSAAFGVIPYMTLGLARDAARDGWGNLFSYHISNTNITVGANGNWSANTDWTRSAWFRTGNTGLITVNDRNGATVTPIATGVVAVVVSHGRNGLGAYTVGGTRNTLPTTGTDEESNTNAGSTYYRREVTTDDAATGGPFDDQVLILTARDLLEPLFREGSLRSPAALANDTLQKMKLAVIGHAMGFLSIYGESDCTSTAPPKTKCRMVVSADTADGGAEVGNNDGLVPFINIGIPLAEALDPWGMRYRYKPNLAVITNASGYGISSILPAANTIAIHIYSQGPNRTDDGGLGDDIAISVSVSEVRGYMANLLP